MRTIYISLTITKQTGREIIGKCNAEPYQQLYSKQDVMTMSKHWLRMNTRYETRSNADVISKQKTNDKADRQSVQGLSNMLNLVLNIKTYTMSLWWPSFYDGEHIKYFSKKWWERVSTYESKTLNGNLYKEG